MVFGTCIWAHQPQFFIYDRANPHQGSCEEFDVPIKLRSGTRPWPEWLEHNCTNLIILSENITIADIPIKFPELFI